MAIETAHPRVHVRDVPSPISMSNRRMLASCFLGTTIEWYDFLVYGFLAPLALNRLFFPSLSPLAGTIAGFGVFAVGFAARPLGGVVFAHFGDRVGRKPIMVTTLVMMGVSTTAIGLTPTFATVGIAAPIILVCLRFLQGFSLGAESATGPLLAMESAPGNTRGLFAALVSSGAAAGTVLGALAAFAVGTLPQEELASVKVGMPVRVTLEGAKAPLDGTISAVDPTIDPTTRNVKLRAAIPDLKETTRPGMFVNVQVITPEQKAVVSVPATAIVHASFGDSVFVIEDKKPRSPEDKTPDKTPDGKTIKIARQQFVRVGVARGDFVAITKGVSAGQQVVSAGAFKLRNNSPVFVDNTVKPDAGLDPHPENR